jgi:hypothetical protein
MMAKDLEKRKKSEVWETPLVLSLFLFRLRVEEYAQANRP